MGPSPESSPQKPQKLSLVMRVGRAMLHGLLQCAAAMRSLIRTIGRYISWRGRQQTPRLDMTNALRYMSKPENKEVFEALNTKFKAIKKSYGLEDNVSLKEFFKKLPKDPDKAEQIKQARYELAMFLSKQLCEQGAVAPEIPMLKDVLIGIMARGLGVDAKHHSYRVEGNFEQETSKLLNNLSELIDQMESDPTIQNSVAWEPKKSAAHISDDEQGVSQLTDNSQSDDLGHLLDEALIRASEMGGLPLEQPQKKETVLRGEGRANDKKPSLAAQYRPKLHVKAKNFDKEDFMVNHARHLPKIINLLNHILTQAAPGQNKKQQEEFRQDMYKMVKGMILQKYEPDKKQKGRFDPLIAHLKEESPSEGMSREEIRALNQRNEARDHLIATLVHTLFPSLKEHGDFEDFNQEFKNLLNKTKSLKDINTHLTAKMIGILREPEHQDYAKNILEVALYKIFKYTPEQMHEDAQLRQSSHREQQAAESPGGKNPPPQKGFASFLVDKILNSKHLSDQNLSQIMRDLKSSPLSACATLLIGASLTNGQSVSLNDSFINEVLLEDRRGMLRFAAKAIMKVMPDSDITSAPTEAERQKRREQAEKSLLQSLENLYGEQAKDPEDLSKLIEAVAYLAAGKEQKNKDLLRQGVDKMFLLLPTLNNQIFQENPPSYLATQMARKLWKIPKDCSWEERQRHQSAQLSFLRSIQNSLAKNPRESFKQIFVDILSSDNIKKDYSILLNTSTWAAGSESMKVMLDTYNRLDPEEKQCFNKGLPAVQNALSIAQISYNAYDIAGATPLIIATGVAVAGQELAQTAYNVYDTGCHLIGRTTQVLGGAYNLLTSCWGLGHSYHEIPFSGHEKQSKEVTVTIQIPPLGPPGLNTVDQNLRKSPTTHTFLP